MASHLETELKRSPYTLGIIGYGRIGKIHYDALAKSGQTNFQVRAIADPRAQFEDASVQFYSDYRDLLRNSNIQAVSINTPPSTHYQLVIDAFRSGKHVLVEKPPALNIEECDEMASFAAERNKVLFMAFHARYNPAVEAARKELAGKNISRVNIEYSEYAPNYHAVDGWIFNPEIAGGGVLMDSGINALSIVTYVLPDTYSLSVGDTQFEKAGGFRVETKVQVEFSFGNQGRGKLSMDWMNKNPEVRQVTFATEENEYMVDIVKNSFTQDGETLISVDATRKAVDQESEYRGVYQDFAKRLFQRKSLISTRELRFILEAYKKGKI